MTQHTPAQAVVDEPQCLEDAVRQLIELGFNDPLEIARRLERMHGPDWMTTQLAMLSEDLVAEIARKQLGQRRRGFEIALRPGQPLAQTKMKLVGFWIPAVDGTPAWKSAGRSLPRISSAAPPGTSPSRSACSAAPSGVDRSRP